MLLIPCPHCGPREQAEFDYGGRAIALPPLDASVGEWHQALHLGGDGDSRVDEHWYHAAGCERWTRVSRNQHSHEIDHLAASTQEAPE